MIYGNMLVVPLHHRRPLAAYVALSLSTLAHLIYRL